MPSQASASGGSTVICVEPGVQRGVAAGEHEAGLVDLRARSSVGVAAASRLPLTRSAGRAGPGTRRSGMTGRIRSGWTSAVPAPSATAVTILTPVHRPLARERATPCRPRSRISCTLPGKSVGSVQVGQRVLRARRQRGGLAGRVVAGQGQHAAEAGGAGVVGVADGVAGPVEARRLAVPDAERRRRRWPSSKVDAAGCP